MYIGEYMRSPVITLTSDTLIHDAQKIMQQHNIRRLPVVDRGKLVGLITQDRLREIAPSPATSLSIWEMYYLLAKMKVKDVMVTDVVTITPDTTVEETCVLGQKRNIGTFPVVDEKGDVVGIVTTTDLYRLITQILGFGERGVRLHVVNGEKGVVQHQVMEILCKHQADVLAAFPVTPVGSQQRNFIIHLATEDAGPIVEDIKKLGFGVEAREH